LLVQRGDDVGEVGGLQGVEPPAADQREQFVQLDAVLGAGRLGDVEP
jgi:hypothetical protein